MSDRKHLVSAEVDKLLAATKGSRNEVRDRCLLLLMFRHGLRVSEACGLKLSQVDTESRVPSPEGRGDQRSAVTSDWRHYWALVLPVRIVTICSSIASARARSCARVR